VVFGNIRLFRLAGIQVNVHVSWFLTIIFITTVLALRLYPSVFPAGSRLRDDWPIHWAMAAVSSLVFFASVLLHELAHSLVARRQGLPVRSITLFIFGGMAQISREAARPLHEFVMAAVGPLTSLLLGGAFFAVWWLLGARNHDPVSVVLQWLFLMNLVVGLFNLAPGFPMDGGRILRSALWGITGSFRKASLLSMNLGRTMGFGLMAFGVVSAFGVFSFVDGWSGLWLFLLGMFLQSAARESWLQTEALASLRDYTAADLMDRELRTVEGAAPLSAVLPLRQHDHYLLFVTDDARQVVGVLSEKEVAALAAEARSSRTAGETMTPAALTPTASADDDGARLLERMDEGQVWHLPVVDDGRVVGVVDRESIVKIVAARLFPARERRRR
jgi:Zn-dependent protease/predicted transcriptional regulator